MSRQEAEEKAGDLATKQSMVNAAQANVDRYVAMKAFTRIVAPFDGIVTSRSTDVGALINAGSGTGPELFMVSDTQRLRVYVNVPQNYVALIGRGTKAQLTVPEHRGKTYDATVESTSGAVNAASGQHADPARRRQRGRRAAARRLRERQPRAAGDAATLDVPPGALIFDRNGTRVATVDANDHVVLKPVTIARDLGRVVELASGLSPNDRVIDSPPDSIANGDVGARRAAADAKDAKAPARKE